MIIGNYLGFYINKVAGEEPVRPRVAQATLTFRDAFGIPILMIGM